MNIESVIRENNIGVWEWDSTTNKLYWNETMYKIYAIPESAFDGNYNSFFRMVYPEDRQEVQRFIDAALEAKTRYALTFRIIDGNGRLKYIRAYGECVSRDDRIILSGINIIIEQEDFEAGTKIEELSDKICKIHKTAKRILFDLVKIGYNYTKIVEPPTDYNWHQKNDNTKFRNLSADKTKHLIIEYISKNNIDEKLYENNDKTIVNLNHNPITIIVEGEEVILYHGNSLFIPRRKIHKIIFDGQCHYQVIRYYFYKSK